MIKKTGRVEHKSIRSVCSQDDFYNLPLTKICDNQPKLKQALQEEIDKLPDGVYLTCDKAITEIETKTGEIVKKVLYHQNLTVLNDKEKAMLCMFTALQMFRTSHHRNDIKTIMESLTNKVKEFFEAGLMKDSSYDAWQEENVGKDLDIAAKLLNITNLGKEVTSHAGMLFLTKNMFLIDTIDEDLYISDSPVVLHNKNDFRPYGNIGTLVPGIEIYLPLSSHIILAFHCKTLLPPYKMLVNCQKEFYEHCEAIENGGCIHQRDTEHFFNYLQLCYSDRYLIAKSDCFQYAIDLIKTHPQYEHCTAKLVVR